MIPASRYSSCDFCGEKGCEGCPLKYDEKKTVGEFLKDDTKGI